LVRLECVIVPVAFGRGDISEGVPRLARFKCRREAAHISSGEQQTTGLIQIANVIFPADFHPWPVRPRDEIRFARVEWETARSLLIGAEKPDVVARV